MEIHKIELWKMLIFMVLEERKTGKNITKFQTFCSKSHKGETFSVNHIVKSQRTIELKEKAMALRF